jgi:hypothetical protein
MIWGDFFEVMTIIIQLLMAFMIIPACLVCSAILIVRLIKMVEREIN